ncbi:hypothetical protein ACQRIT_004705 [Beauveria bassiana]
MCRSCALCLRQGIIRRQPQDVYFYNGIAFYQQFRGIVLGSAERNAIADTIGGQSAAILRNHGLLTAGASIEAAVF